MRQVVFVAGVLLCVGRINASVDTLNLWQLPVILSAGYFQAMQVPLLDLTQNQNKQNILIGQGYRDTFDIFRKLKETEEKIINLDEKLELTYQSDSEKLNDDFSAGVFLSSFGIGHEIDTTHQVASTLPGMILLKGRKKKKLKPSSGSGNEAQSTSNVVHASSFYTEKDKVWMVLFELLSILNSLKKTHYSYSNQPELCKFENIISECRANLQSFDECFYKSRRAVAGKDRVKPEMVREFIVERCQELSSLDQIFIVSLKDQLPGLAVHGIEELLDLSSGVSSAEVMPSLRLLFPLMAYFEPFLNQMLPGVQYLQLFMTDTENTFLLLLSTDGKECFDICFFEGAGVMISDQSCVKKMTEFSVLLALMATINRKKNGRGQFYFLGRMRYLDEKLSLAMSVQDIITICGASSYGGVQSTTSEEVEVFTDVDLGCEPFWGEVCQETTSSIVDVYFVKGRGSAEAVRINRDKRAVYNAQLSRLISQLGSPVRGWTSLSSLKAFSFFKMSRLPVGHLVLVENEHLLEGFLANKDWTEEERDQITRLHLANCGYYTVTETLGLDIDKRDAAVVNLKAEELRMEIYIHLLRRLIQQDCDQRGTESTIGETSSAFGGGAAGR